MFCRCPFAGKVPESFHQKTPVPQAPGSFEFGALMQQALIQVYTGPGKGKTTAATGLIVRALGQDLKVLLVRFLKPLAPASSELVVLEKLSGLDIVSAGLGGIDARNRPEELRRNVSAAFAQVRPMILGGF